MKNPIIARFAYRSYRFMGWSAIGMASLLVVLRLVGGYFAPCEKKLIEWAQSNFPYKLAVGSAKVGFLGWDPAVKLVNVQVFNPDSQLALKIDQVNVVLNLFSFLFNKVELSEIVIDGMNVGIEYHQDGSITVSDLNSLKWTPNQNQSSLMSVRHLVIKNSDLHLVLNEQQSLPLAEVDVHLDAHPHFKMTGQAMIVGPKPSRIQFVLDFPYFFKNDAEFYCQLQNADLAQLFRLVNHQSVALLQSGEMDAQIWGTFSSSRKASLISDVRLSKMEWMNKQHQVYLFEPVNALIQLSREEDNWTMQAKWVETTIDKNYYLDAKSYPCHDAQCTELRSSQLKAAQIAYWTQQFNVLPRFTHWLEQYDVKGDLDTLFVKLRSFNGEMLPLEGEIAFSNFSVESSRQHPSVHSFDGALRYENNVAQLLLTSPKAKFEYAPWFETPLYLSNLKAWVTLFNQDDMLCQAKLSHVYLGETELSGEATVHINEGKIADLEMSVGTNQLTLAQALTMLPKKAMDHDLVAWLQKSLKSGKILESALLFRGDPHLFPFDNNEGVFNFVAKLEDLTLDYQAAWPALSKARGTLLFENRKMVVDVEKAQFEGANVLATRAVIPDLISSKAMLLIDGKIKTDLEKAKEIISKTPLKEKIGTPLSPLALKGMGDLDLNLAIPLCTKHDHSPVKVKGQFNIDKTSLHVPAIDLNIDKIKGSLLFTESTLTANNLFGMMLGKATRFNILNGKSENDPPFVIEASGILSYLDLKKWLNLAEYEVITGETPYQATLSLFADATKHPIKLEVNTPLTGMVVNAPKPFLKEKDVAVNTQLKLEIDPNQQSRVQVNYGPQTSFAIALQRHENEWKCNGAHLNFGETPKASYRDDNVFLIDGYLADAKVDEWKSFLAGDTNSKVMMEPLLALKFGKLDFHGETFLKTHVEARRDNTLAIWNLNFEGPSIKGHITVPLSQDSRDIVVNLDKLTLTTANEEASDWVTGKTALERPIEVTIKKLKLDKKVFTEFQARIEPSWKGYDFPRIQAKMKGTDILVSGQWDTLTPTKQVSVEGKIYSRNTTDTFKAIGKKGTIQRAKGSVDFSVAWQGSPAKIDFPTLSGKAEFKLNQGYVQGMDPGIGRVLNLLSLDTVQRRLNLDFNDVTRSGFAFDEFTGKFQFRKGKISSNQVSLKGPSADIEGHGQADLLNQDINGEMVVMPNVTGSLPVAAAIAAGNPAVGAAVWVVDKMLGKKLQEIHQYRYRLLGTWDAPKLEEISVAPIKRS